MRIIPLALPFNLGDIVGMVYPVLLEDDHHLVLVDCGYPGMLPTIQTAAQAKGLDLAKLTHIVLSHHDFDHLGALAALKKAYPGVSICASEYEASFISGKRESARLKRAGAFCDTLPENAKGEKPGELFRSIRPVPVEVLLRDRAVFPWCGGTEIVATPGHMPGHLSLYLEKFKTLISGDALVVKNEELAFANPKYNLDPAEARHSIQKLLDYDVETVICYHGGSYRGAIRASLEHLLADEALAEDEPFASALRRP